MNIASNGNKYGQEKIRMRPLLSHTLLRQILGVLWIIDGLLQLQPRMFTMNMVNGVMAANVPGQPGPIAASLIWIIGITTQYLTYANWSIAIIQVFIGVGLLFGWRVKAMIIISVIWAFIIWYAGEGMSLLLTGQASALSGWPGSVLIYALLGIALWPRSTTSDGEQGNGSTLLSRRALRWFLAGYWLVVGLLQLQPYWWQPDQISQSVAAMTQPGTLSGVIVDPTLRWLSAVSAGNEIPFNTGLIIVFLGLGLGIAFVKTGRIRPLLVASIIASLFIWWFGQSLGMILTGMSTDPNTGPMIILLTLACWPVFGASSTTDERKPSSAPSRSADLMQPRV